MKKVFLGLLLTGALFSCKKQNEYQITGTVPNDLNGQMVYLQVPNEEFEYKSIDSTKVQKGTFIFKGHESEPVIAAIKWDEDKRPIAVVLQEGNIKVVTTPEPEVSGTPLNDSLQFVSTLDIRENPYVDQFIENNKDNIVGAYIMSYVVSGYTYDEINQVFSGATDAFKNSIYGKRIKKFSEALKRSEVGAKYTNLKMDDPEGKEISLSDYVGKDKYVLIDFWASWCGPCRREMPKLVDAYAKYKSKGFEIVGVSLDANVDSWKNAITTLNMTWPQMSDLKGWESKATEVYGLAYIPQTLLVAPDGKIIAKNIGANPEGPSLEEVLSEYLK